MNKFEQLHHLRHLYYVAYKGGNKTKQNYIAKKYSHLFFNTNWLDDKNYGDT